MTPREIYRKIVSRLKISGLSDSPDFDARLILSYVLRCELGEVFRAPSRCLDSDEVEKCFRALGMRLSGMPIAYITGEIEFYGYSFLVRPGVFIPKIETEVMIDLVKKEMVGRGRGGRILDLGTGSGVILLTLLREIEAFESGVGVDITRAAQRLASLNRDRLGLRHKAQFFQGDWDCMLGRQKFDCVTANPPYVARRELLSREVRDWEPHRALISPDSGLGDIRRILSLVPRLLRSRGLFCMEIAEYYTEKVVEMARNVFNCYEIKQDLTGRDRFLLGRSG